ncbi:MAG: hypothetical protein MR494_05380 [Spirochaetia bacterium]|nr:hypothetical protein [Spirochaetia bacterium]
MVALMQERNNEEKGICYFIFLCCVITQNLFAYYYRTHINDWRGETIYNVSVSDFTDGSHVTKITDINRYINYCFVCPNKNSAMEMYQILSRMNIATIQEVLRTTKWKYWFTQESQIYYKADGCL